MTLVKKLLMHVFNSNDAHEIFSNLENQYEKQSEDKKM